MCIRNILSSRLGQKFWKYNIKNTKTSPWKFVCEIHRPTSDSKVRWKLINLNCFSPLRFSQSHQYDNNNIISKLHCPFRNPLNKKQKKKQNNEKHYHYYSQQQNKQEQKQHMITSALQSQVEMLLCSCSEWSTDRAPLCQCHFRLIKSHVNANSASNPRRWSLE